MANKYLLKTKLIGDISIYSERSTKEHIYDFPKDYLVIGQAYVDKLKELECRVQGNKFFLIYFNRMQKDGKIRYEAENKWDLDGYGRQEVHVGVDHQKFNSLSEKEKDIFITKLISKILQNYYKRYSVDLSKIKEVESLFLKYGGIMEVVFKAKATKKYKLVFNYQTYSHDEADARIKYIDLINSQNNKTLTVHLRDFYSIEHVIECTKVINGTPVVQKK